MAAAFLLLVAAVVVLAGGLTLCPAGLARALPFVVPPGLPAPGWPRLAGALAAAALLVAAGAALAARRRVHDGGERSSTRPLIELVAFFVPLAGYLWAVLPGSGPRWRDLPALLALAALAGWLLWRDRHVPGGPGRRSWRELWAGFRPAVRLLAVPTGIMIAVPLVAGIAAHARPRPGALLLSLAGYPLFACVQLLIFLVLPLPRLRRLTGSPVAAALATAALFALAHWPNGPLMAGCFAAMVVWALAYQKRPSLPAIALSMGLAATAVVQLPPAAWLAHARVGPGYVRYRAITELAAGESATGPAAPAPFVRDLYRGIVGREAAPDETAAWSAALAGQLRARIAWQFLDSAEHRARGGSDAPPAGGRWSELGEPWRSRLAAYGSDAAYRAAGGEAAGFLRGLYGELLGREASARELAEWAPAFGLDPVQRRHLARTFYDRRRELARDGPAAVIAALRLP